MQSMLYNLLAASKLALVLAGMITAWIASKAAPGRYSILVSERILFLCTGLALCIILWEAGSEIQKFATVGRVARDIALWSSGFMLFEAVSTASCSANRRRRLHSLLCEPDSISTAYSQDQAEVRTAQSISECQALISGKTAPGKFSNNLLDPYEARSRPNQRLVTAFGIQNCFTSPSISLCKKFRNTTETLLYADEEIWIYLALTARATANKQFSTDSPNLSLFKVVQMVTMKTMLQVLFPNDPRRLDIDQDIATLAAEVNSQWVRSKEEPYSNTASSWVFGNQKTLLAAAKAVFPNWDQEDSENNPFNLILPGYETMWRVVLHCFVEAMARKHKNAKYWKIILIKFLGKPTKVQLWEGRLGKEQGVAAGHIAAEALRLYPPTRRIYRLFKDEAGESEVAADIEALHRSPDIWNDAPSTFCPERWSGRSDTTGDPRFLAFGCKPFRCPAGRETDTPMPFGLSMIALLVAALLEASDKCWAVEGDFPDDGRPLKTDRQAYEGARLVRSTR